MRASNHHTDSSNRVSSGFSLVEVLVIVTVIGILSLLAVGQYGRVMDRTRETVALNTVETLNQGVSRYSQVEGGRLNDVPADDDSFEEEIDVLRALQWVDPDLPTPGGPYVRADFDPAGTADTDTYRAVWNGSFFELRVPAEAGAGLRIELIGNR